MSKLYFQHPVDEPNRIMKDLGVWTPEEYHAELVALGLPADEIADRMESFNDDYNDCKAFYRDMLEFDLKRDVHDIPKAALKSGKRGGGKSGYTDVDDNDPNYLPKINGIDMLAQDENFQATVKANYNSEAQTAIRACLDPTVYNINGEPLPHGKILDECVNIYRAKDDVKRMYHRSVLEAAIQCKKKGVNNNEMQTCVDTKIGEMKALLSIQSRVLVAMGVEIEKTETDSATFAPAMAKDLQKFEKKEEKAAVGSETKSWTRWLITEIKGSSVWIASKGADLALWVVKYPKTAKIVFFILKRMLKDVCSYIYVNWLQHAKEYTTMFDVYFSQTKDFAASKWELTKFATVAGFQAYLTGDGFKNTWNKSSKAIGGAIYAMVGDIPFAGKAVQALGTFINDVAQESTKIAIEAAIYEEDVRYAGSLFIEILFVFMPIEFTFDEMTQKYKMQWNTSTESCVGILRQKEKVIGVAPQSEDDTKRSLEQHPDLPPDIQSADLINAFTNITPGARQRPTLRYNTVSELPPAIDTIVNATPGTREKPTFDIPRQSINPYVNATPIEAPELFPVLPKVIDDFVNATPGIQNKPKIKIPQAPQQTNAQTNTTPGWFGSFYGGAALPPRIHTTISK